MAATQEQIDLCLNAVGGMSAMLNEAVVNGEQDKLAAMVAAAQMVETYAQGILQGTIGQGHINDVKAGAAVALGHPWR